MPSSLLLSLQADVYCATFSSNAQFVAGAGSDGIVRVWDVKSRKVQHTFDKPVREYVEEIM